VFVLSSAGAALAAVSLSLLCHHIITHSAQSSKKKQQQQQQSPLHPRTPPFFPITFSRLSSAEKHKKKEKAKAKSTLRTPKLNLPISNSIMSRKRGSVPDPPGKHLAHHSPARAVSLHACWTLVCA